MLSVPQRFGELRFLCQEMRGAGGDDQQKSQHAVKLRNKVATCGHTGGGTCP